MEAPPMLCLSLLSPSLWIYVWVFMTWNYSSATWTASYTKDVYDEKVNCRLRRSPPLCGAPSAGEPLSFRAGVLTTACWAPSAVQRTPPACRWCTRPWTRTAGCGPAPWQQTSTPRPPGGVGDSGSTTGRVSTHASPLIQSNMDIQAICSLMQASSVSIVHIRDHSPTPSAPDSRFISVYSALIRRPLVLSSQVPGNGIEDNIGRSAAHSIPLTTYSAYFTRFHDFLFKACRGFSAGCKVENQ